MSISKHGQTTAVLLSIPEFNKLSGDDLSISAKLKNWREQFNHELVEAKDDFDVERSQDQARDFYW